MQRYGATHLPLTLITFAATMLAAIPAIWSVIRFLRHADELTRLIHLQAMAIAFGAGVIAFTSEFFVARVVSLTPLPDDLLHFQMPWLVMMAAYSVSVVLQHRHYAR
jgi:hypothetical protein